MSVTLPKTILKRFRVEDKGRYWHLFCKRCKDGWKLEKPASNTEWKGAGILHLLNHAYGHDAKRRHDDDCCE